MKAVLRLLRTRPVFALVWSGGVVSSAVQQLVFIAAVLHLHAEGHGPAAIALATIAAALPASLLGPSLGSLSDRLGRLRTIPWAEAARLLPLVALFAWPGVAALYLAVFAGGLLQAVYQPARDAIVPALVGAQEGPAANATEQASANIVAVAAPSLAAILHACGGLLPVVAAAIVLQACALGAAILANGTKKGADAPAPSAEPDARSASGAAGAPIGGLMVLFLAGVLASALWLPLAPDIFGAYTVGPYSGFAMFVAVAGLGGLAGSVAAARWMTLRNALPFALAGAAAETGCLLAFAFLPVGWALFPVALAWGLGAALFGAAFYTSVQFLTPPGMRSRRFGTVRRFDQSGLLAGAGAAAIAAALLGGGAREILAIAGAVEAVIVLAVVLHACGLPRTGVPRLAGRATEEG